MDDLEEEVVETQAGNKNSLVKIGGIVVAIAIIAALAVAGTLYFLDKGDSKSATSEPTADEDISVQLSEKIQPSDTLYYTFEEDFTAPLVSTGIETSRQRYLKVALAITSTSKSAISTIGAHLPKIISEVEQTLREQDFSTLQTKEGKLQLQITLTEVVDAIVMRESNGDHIDKVLITDFVMQ